MCSYYYQFIRRRVAGYSGPQLLLPPTRPGCVWPSQCDTGRIPSMTCQPTICIFCTGERTYHIPSQIILLLRLEAPQVLQHACTGVFGIVFSDLKGLLELYLRQHFLRFPSGKPINAPERATPASSQFDPSSSSPGPHQPYPETHDLLAQRSCS